MSSFYQTAMAFCSPLLSGRAIVLPTWYLKTIMARLVISSRDPTCWSIFTAGFVCKHNTIVFFLSDHKRTQQLLVTGGWYFNVMKITQQGRASVCSAESHSTNLTVLGKVFQQSCQQRCQIPLVALPIQKISNTVTHTSKRSELQHLHLRACQLKYLHQLHCDILSYHLWHGEKGTMARF